MILVAFIFAIVGVISIFIGSVSTAVVLEMFILAALSLIAAKVSEIVNLYKRILIVQSEMKKDKKNAEETSM